VFAPAAAASHSGSPAVVPGATIAGRVPVIGTPELGGGNLQARAVVTADPWSDPAFGYPLLLQHHPARRTSPPPAIDEHHGEGFRPRS